MGGLDRYEEEEGGEGGEGEISGISISVCVNSGAGDAGPPQTSSLLTVDRRLPHQR